MHQWDIDNYIFGNTGSDCMVLLCSIIVVVSSLFIH